MRLLENQGSVLLVGLLITGNGHAADWTGVANIGMGLAHNDNVHLALPGSELSVSSGNFHPAITFLNEGEVSRFSSAIDLNVTRYDNQPELERNEGEINFNWLTRSERSNVSLNADYNVVSSLDNQLETAGITNNQVDRNTANFSPRFFYLFSEQFAIDMKFTYQDVTFDEPGYEGYEQFKVVNFIDYRLSQWDLSLIKNVTEKDKLSLSFSAMDYDGKSNGLQIDGALFSTLYIANERELKYTYKVAQIGYEFWFESNQNIKFGAGVSKQDADNSKLPYLYDTLSTNLYPGEWEYSKSSQRGKVFNVNYEYTHEDGKTLLSLSRDRSAESTGGLVEQDKVSLELSRSVTELLSWSLAVSGSKRKTDEDTSVVFLQDRTSYLLSPSLAWNLNIHWRLSLVYRYSELHTDDGVDDRSSNTFMFNLNWNQPKLF